MSPQFTKKSYSLREVLNAILLSTASVQTVTAIQNAEAQSGPESPTVRLKYVSYQDFQRHGEDRMDVSSPMVWFDTPMTDSWGVSGSFVLDTVSGASPLYLDSLSGASGVGIYDQRSAGNLKFNKKFEDFSIGFGGAVSSEHDYHSDNGVVDIRTWNSDKSRVYAFGISGDADHITSTNDPELSKYRNTGHYFAGVTQIINSISLIQSNINVSNGAGYYTDPYKIFDNRPTDRTEVAWLNRYVVYLNELRSSVHLDYRLYGNSWGLNSHMFEVQYYQPVCESFMVRPTLRYYTQQAANFFSTEVPPLDSSKHNSADQRLSSFGSVTTGVKGVITLTKGFEIDIDYLFMVQDGSLALGNGTGGIKTFGANYLSVGVMGRF
jgi:hypothetical protein